MPETMEIEFWIAVNTDGEHHIDCDSAQDAADGVGGINRVYAMKLTLPVPRVTEVAAEIPDTDGTVNVIVS